jgi:hypothetical protein
MAENGSFNRRVITGLYQQRAALDGCGGIC